ncbi:hypothetical protein [Streptomyces sp. NPDC048825]|uniref:hypothetical protein n=1 Tax=Streptomyces sp. NPDC048825 TaxID=3365592 RepID=UPI00372364FE
MRPQKWSRRFSIQPEAVRLARIYARTRLTMTSWSGDQESATFIVSGLVKNVIEHVGPQHPEGELALDLVVAEDETLLITVTDPSPATVEVRLRPRHPSLITDSP